MRYVLLPNPAFQFQGLHLVDVYQKCMSRKLNLINTSNIAIENKNQVLTYLKWKMNQQTRYDST